MLTVLCPSRYFASRPDLFGNGASGAAGKAAAASVVQQVLSSPAVPATNGWKRPDPVRLTSPSPSPSYPSPHPSLPCIPISGTPSLTAMLGGGEPGHDGGDRQLCWTGGGCSRCAEGEQRGRGPDAWAVERVSAPSPEEERELVGGTCQPTAGAREASPAAGESSLYPDFITPQATHQALLPYPMTTLATRTPMYDPRARRNSATLT